MYIKNIVSVLIFFSIGQFTYADVFKDGGEAYKNGDYETAAKKFLEVAEKKDHRAMYALGSMYAVGQGVELDYNKAFNWLSQASKYGRPDATYKLGLLYENGLGTKQDFRRAARMYNTASKKAYAAAQFRLGLMYANGTGVNQSKIRAYAWMETAQRNMNDGLPLAKVVVEEQTSLGEQATIFSVTGNDVIAEEKDKIADSLSEAEISEAKVLVGKYLKYR